MNEVKSDIHNKLHKPSGRTFAIRNVKSYFCGWNKIDISQFVTNTIDVAVGAIAIAIAGVYQFYIFRAIYISYSNKLLAMR